MMNFKMIDPNARLMAAATIAAGLGAAIAESTPESVAAISLKIADAIAAKVETDEATRDEIERERDKVLHEAARESQKRVDAAQARNDALNANREPWEASGPQGIAPPPSPIAEDVAKIYGFTPPAPEPTFSEDVTSV